MGAVCADVGLSKNKKVKLISQNGIKKDINVTELWLPPVIYLKFRRDFYEIIYLQNEAVFRIHGKCPITA